MKKLNKTEKEILSLLKKHGNFSATSFSGVGVRKTRAAISLVNKGLAVLDYKKGSVGCGPHGGQSYSSHIVRILSKSTKE